MGDNLFKAEIQTDAFMQDINKLKVTIENFRSIEKIELELDNLTQIIGRNNSGKTNILHAIRKAINNEDLDDNDFRNKQVIQVTITHGGKEYLYSAKFGDKKLCLPDRVRPPIEVVYLPAFPDIKDVTSSSGTKAFGKLLGMIEIESGTSEQIDEIINNARDEIRVIDQHNLQIIKRSILDDLKQCDVSIIDIDYAPSEVDNSAFLRERNLQLSDIFDSNRDWECWGHGTQRLLLLLVYLQLAKGKIQNVDSQKKKTSSSNEVLCIIEEPEVFMHPHQQKAVARKLYELSSNSRFKVLISTHSPYFINPMSIHSLRVVNKKDGITNVTNKGKGSYEFSIDYLKEQKKEIEKYVFEFFTSLRLEPELREFFFAQKVLVVEGYSERLAIPWMLDRYCSKYDLNNKSISIFNSRGNAKIISCLRILDTFGIPYIVAMDNDFGDNEQTNAEIKKIKEYLGEFRIKDLILLDGDCCSMFGLPKDKDRTASEYDVFNRIQELEKSETEDKKTKEAFNSFLEQIIQSLDMNDNPLASQP